MKKNTVLVLHKGKVVPIQIHHNSYLEDLKYVGTNDGNRTFFLDECKIGIPVGTNRIDINRYQFEVQEASEDSITMIYLGPKKKPK